MSRALFSATSENIGSFCCSMLSLLDVVLRRNSLCSQCYRGLQKGWWWLRCSNLLQSAQEHSGALGSTQVAGAPVVPRLQSPPDGRSHPPLFCGTREHQEQHRFLLSCSFTFGKVQGIHILIYLCHLKHILQVRMTECIDTVLCEQS